MGQVRGSILIAAHNEAARLPICLAPLRTDLDAGAYELVVVSNGSTDDTGTTARRLLAGAPRGSVIELDEASKAGALRVGDAHLSAFPRAYVDADVVVDAEVLAQLFATLQSEDTPLVAAPTLQIDTAASSAIVRRYFRVWTSMPYIADGVVGTGIYAVNEPGWQRLGTFPGLLNDDEWVARHFSQDERRTSPGHFRATAARTVSALVRQRARVEQGNRELSETDADTDADADAGAVVRSTSIGDLRSGLKRADYSVADALCFLVVVVATRVLAAWRRKRGTARAWSTDTTSRSSDTRT